MTTTTPSARRTGPRRARRPALEALERRPLMTPGIYLENFENDPSNPTGPVDPATAVGGFDAAGDFHHSYPSTTIPSFQRITGDDAGLTSSPYALGLSALTEYSAEDAITFPHVDTANGESVALASIVVGPRPYASTVRFIGQGDTLTRTFPAGNDWIKVTVGSGELGDQSRPIGSIIGVDLHTNGFGIAEFDSLSIFVQGPGADNTPPTPTPTTVTVLPGTSKEIDIADLGEDIDGDALSISRATATTGTVVNHGQSLTYTPPAGFRGVDEVGYTLDDGRGGTATASVQVIVDTPPVARDVGYSLPHGASGALDVPDPEHLAGLLSLASDADRDPLTAVPQTGATALGGSATIRTDGSFSYTPPPGDALRRGIDSFTYRVTDGLLDSNPGEILIQIPNGVPQAMDQSFSFEHVPFRDPVHRPGSKSDLVTADHFGPLPASDPDSDPLTYVLVSPPAHGGLVLSPDGSFTYEAEAQADSFSYRVFDGVAYSNVATVRLEVQDDRPVFLGDFGEDPQFIAAEFGLDPLNVSDGVFKSTDFDTRMDPWGGSLLDRISDTDDPRESLTPVLKSQPSRGHVELSTGGHFFYTLYGSTAIDAASFNTIEDTFTYTVTDGYRESPVVTCKLIFNFHGTYMSEDVGSTAVVETADGRKVTLTSDRGTTLHQAGVGDNPHPGDSPDNLLGIPGALRSFFFPEGFLHFNVVGVAPGGKTTITMYLDVAPAAYFKYGPTLDDPTPHWYNFAYDGTTGAQIFPNPIPRKLSMVVLHFVDGQRGDDDLTANGVIVEPGAPVVRHFASPRAGFLISLYELSLEREPTAAEFARGMRRLERGAPRRRLVREVWDSPEHRGMEVDRLYRTLLHRTPDRAERAHGVRALRAGVGETAMARRLLTSREYRDPHPTRASFVAGLAADVLGQPAGPADPSLRRLLRRGPRAGRSMLATTALTSRDAAARLLTADDETFLARDARPAEVRRASRQLRGGSAAPAAIAERILASKEFMDLAASLSAPAGTRPGTPRTTHAKR